MGISDSPLRSQILDLLYLSRRNNSYNYYYLDYFAFSNTQTFGFQSIIPKNLIGDKSVLGSAYLAQS